MITDLPYRSARGIIRTHRIRISIYVVEILFGNYSITAIFHKPLVGAYINRIVISITFYRHYEIRRQITVFCRKMLQYFSTVFTY